MANDNKDLKIGKKPQEVSEEDLKKVSGGNPEPPKSCPNPTIVYY